MQIGMVGLGRMGGNMAERLRRAGHEVIGFDRDPDVTDVGSLADLVRALAKPRAVWVMVPAGLATEETVGQLADLLDRGDIVVDGGNSNYRDTMRRADLLDGKGIEMVDAGTSGGVWGLAEGYCFMVGGSEEAYARLEPVLLSLAQEGGVARVGPTGAGHFTKMVHNGIEYGLLQAYAEGFELLSATQHFELDVAAIAQVWRHGSVVRSWLLDLTAQALARDPELSDLRGYVEDSGEGRWTVIEAIEQAVPMPMAALALFARFNSRDDNSYAMRLIAALRREFGGHAVLDT